MSAKFLLSRAQMNRLSKGSNVNVTHKQMIGPERKHNKEVELQLSEAELNKLEKAMQHGKGYRLLASVYANNIVGGSFSLKSIGKAMKKASKIGNVVGKEVASRAVMIGTKQLSDIGVINDKEKAKADKAARSHFGKGTQASKDKMAKVRAAKASKNHVVGGEVTIKKGKLRGSLEGISGLKKSLGIIKRTVANQEVIGNLQRGRPVDAITSLGRNVNKELQYQGVNTGVKDSDLKKAQKIAKEMDKYQTKKEEKKKIAGGSFRTIKGKGVGKPFKVGNIVGNGFMPIV